jgi:hypothetical protein
MIWASRTVRFAAQGQCNFCREKAIFCRKMINYFSSIVNEKVAINDETRSGKLGARGSETDPIRELPYEPAAVERLLIKAGHMSAPDLRAKS